MRLIDADALIRKVRFLTLRDGKEIEIHYVEAERIDSAPTIDAVPVTRCRDCRYFYQRENTTRGWCELFQHGCPNADDYCSDAERREERKMNKYQRAIETLKNEYDAFYFENKYGEGTHPEEFATLSELEGELVPNAIGWIRNCYDCYYQHELDEDSAFAYLEKIAAEREEE